MVRSFHHLFPSIRFADRRNTQGTRYVETSGLYRRALRDRAVYRSEQDICAGGLYRNDRREGRDMPFMYILECGDGSYYTGSTVDLERRLKEHQNGIGANYTIKKQPVKLVYFEEYSRVDAHQNVRYFQVAVHQL